MLFWCSICHELMKEDGHISATKCGHLFHHPCLDPWINSSQNCPQCREPVLEGSVIRVWPTAADRRDAAGGDETKLLCEIQETMFEALNNNAHGHTLEKLLENCESLRASIAFRDSVADTRYKEINKLKKENEEHKQSVAALNRELSTATEDATARLSKVDKLENLVQDYKDDISSHIEIQNLLRDNVQALDGELNLNRNDLIRAQQTAVDLEQQIEDSNNTVADLERRIRALNSKVADLEQQLDGSNNKVDDLQQQLDDSNHKVAGLQQQLNDSNHIVADLQQQLNDLNRIVAFLQQQLDDSNDKVADLQQQLDESNDKVADLQQQLDDSNDKVADLQQQLDESNDKVADLQQQLDESNDKVADLQQQLDDSNDKVADLRQPLEHSSYTVADLQQVNDSSHKVADTKQVMEDLNNEIVRLDQVIRESNNRIKQKNVGSTKIVADLEKEIEYSNDKIIVPELKLEEFDTIVSDLENEVNDSNKNVSDPKLQVKNFNTKVDRAVRKPISKKKTKAQCHKLLVINKSRAQIGKSLNLINKSRMQLRELLILNKSIDRIKKLLLSNYKPRAVLCKFMMLNNRSGTKVGKFLIKDKSRLDAKMWTWAVSAVNISTGKHNTKLLTIQRTDKQNKINSTVVKKIIDGLNMKMQTMDCEITNKNRTISEQALFLSTLQKTIKGQMGTLLQQIQENSD